MKTGINVDLFAGGGGAAVGLHEAGVHIDIAINHDPEALAMYRANFPDTHVIESDIFDIDPATACDGHPVGLLWASPDCTYFSKARGAKPIRDVKRRSLATAVIHWASLPEWQRPLVIMLENVEEFRTWGPLLKNNTPCPRRRGRTFSWWLGKLQSLGYDVEHRELRACDYGSPTIRKRLFVIARRDGFSIKWPGPTHGPEEWQIPFRTTAECIDWSIPCPSIFNRSRPLAEKTLARIANGIKRFVIDAAEPFIIGAGGPTNGAKPCGTFRPGRTQTTENRKSLIVPYGVPRYGERPGQAPRVIDINSPSTTIVPTANQFTLVAAFLAKHFGGMTGVPVTTPFPTITARGTQNQLVTSHLTLMRGTCKDGRPVTEPSPCITAGGNHIAEVRAFLYTYYGNSTKARSLNLPTPTLTTKDRLGLVTVSGVEYQIYDIGMRILTPRELYRCQGFPEDYVIDPIVNGKPITKTSQVRMCGNSVCPQLSWALARSNFNTSMLEATA